MLLQPYAEQVQQALTAAAGLGDDTVRRTAEALAAAAEPAVRLALLAAVSAAADEVTGALLDAPGAPRVSCRLAGDEVLVDVQVATEGPPPAAPVVEDDEAAARVSLRLSDALKQRVDAAARAEGLSANAWLVRAAHQALDRPVAGTRTTSTGRLSGWVHG